MKLIKAKERDAVLQALRAGVVPRAGQHHIQVGRAPEVAALVKDLQRVAEGGTAFRLVIGEYGAGKTFFLSLMRNVGRELKLVTMHADLNPQRRLHAADGQARSLFAELAKNLATRTKPDGGALGGIIEKFIAGCRTSAEAQGASVERVLHQQLAELSEMVNGYDFATVLAAYWRGFESGNDELKAHALRWLRGEYTTKTEARAALGVRSIVADASFYDHLKLMARFVRLAGFGGLLVCLDEMVNLYKIAHPQPRNANYEQLLRMLNDALQGTTEGLGLIFGGTPEFLLDTRRGLYSYDALRSRLAENSFARAGLVDYSGPVLRLASLTPEELFMLLHKLRHLYASGDPSAYLVPDAALEAFMLHCAARLGEAYFRTPRTTITAFVNFLAVLEQNPAADWRSLLNHIAVEKDTGDESDFPARLPAVQPASVESHQPVAAHEVKRINETSGASLASNTSLTSNAGGASRVNPLNPNADDDELLASFQL